MLSKSVIVRLIFSFFSSRFLYIKNSFSECDAVDKLASFYAAQKDFRGQSFDTISSSGGTGSIIHYKPKRGSDQKIGKCMYLLDAGAHYSCGTTDTTRTIHCGEPSEFEKECYTLVLQGMNLKNIFKIDFDLRLWTPRSQGIEKVA